MIHFPSGFHKFTKSSSQHLKTWILNEVKREGKSIDRISITVHTDDELRQINKSFLNHDYYTDIITFDYSHGKIISGELLISQDRVIENASSYSSSTATEWNRVIIHGVLHLCGYKDSNKSQQDRMRLRENKALKRFELKGLNQSKGKSPARSRR